MVKLTDFGVDLSGMGVGIGIVGISKGSRSITKNIGTRDSDDFSLMTESEMSSLRGSFDYLAPERMIGGGCSFPSDIWSFGVTIHAVAIGSYPYTVNKEDFWGMLNALQEQPIPLPSSSDFSTDFVDFVRQACARESNRRPTALQLLNHPFILSSPPPSSNYQSHRYNYATARKPLLATVPEKAIKKKRNSGMGAASILGLGSSRETSREGGTGGSRVDLPRGRKSNTTEGTRARVRVVEETRASWSQEEGRRARPRHLHPLSPTKDIRRTKSSSSALSSSSSSKSKSPSRRQPQQQHQQSQPLSSSSPHKQRIPSTSPHRQPRIPSVTISPFRASVPRKQLVPMQGRGRGGGGGGGGTSMSKSGPKSSFSQRDQGYPSKGYQGHQEDAWRSHDKDTGNDNDNDDVSQPLFPSAAAEALHIAKAWKAYVRHAQQGQQQHGNNDIMAAAHNTTTNTNSTNNNHGTSDISANITTTTTINHQKINSNVDRVDQSVGLFPPSVQPLSTASVDALALQLCSSTGT